MKKVIKSFIFIPAIVIFALFVFCALSPSEKTSYAENSQMQTLEENVETATETATPKSTKKAYLYKEWTNLKQIGSPITVTFTSEASKIQGATFLANVGATDINGTTLLSEATTEVDQIEVYEIGSYEFIVYSPSEIYAPKDSSTMFVNAQHLTKVNFENFNTFFVENLRGFFGGCHSLSTVNLSSFNTTNLDNISDMFVISGIKEIEFPSNFDTSNVTDMNSLFWGCSELTKITFSNSFKTNNVTNMCQMFKDCLKLKEITFPTNFNTSRVTNMSFMFDGCTSLSSLNLSNFNTSNVTTMESMFENCESLTALDLSNFNTSNVTTMESMFSGCTDLKTLTSSSNFDTSKVTTMKSMFFVTGLTEINLPESFNTKNVTTMRTMFEFSSDLKKITFSSNFVTNNVTDMTAMFHGCSSLTDLDVSNFNTSKVKYMHLMFEDCSSLTTLDVSNFDTSNVVYSGETLETISDLGYMFYGCSKLTSLDVSGFKTGKAKYMTQMFKGCSSLTELNLSNFDTTNVIDVSDFLTGCSSLKKVIGPKVVNASYLIDLPADNGKWYDTTNATLNSDVTNISNNERTYLLGYNVNRYNKTTYIDTIIKLYNVDLIMDKPQGSDYSYLIAWNTSADGTGTEYLIGAFYTSNNSVDLYAIIEVKKYTLTYNFSANGGTYSSKTSEDIPLGTEVDLTKVTAVKSGWEHIGWNIDKDARNKQDSLIMPEENTTIYAIYKKTLSANFYQVGSVDPYIEYFDIFNTSTVTEWGILSAPNIDVNINYPIAIGWSNEYTTKNISFESGELNVTVKNGVSYYAKRAVDITLSYDANGKTLTNALPQNQTDKAYSIANGTNIETILKANFTISDTIPTTNHYTFAYYTKNSDGTGNKFNTGESIESLENITLFAQWDAKKYTLTYDFSTNEGISASVTSILIAHGSKIDLTVTANKPNWIHLGWNEDKNATTKQEELIMPAGDKTIYAIFSKTLTANFYQIGANTPQVLSHEIFNTESDTSWINSDKLPKVNIVDGYTVVGWSINTNSSNVVFGSEEINATINNNQSYFAVCQKQVTLTYNANEKTLTNTFKTSDSGYIYIIADTDKGNILPFSVTISSEKPQTQGYDFTNWNTNPNNLELSYIPGQTIQVYNDATIYAIWKILQYTLTIKPNGGSYNYSTNDTKITQDYGSSYNLLEVLKLGYDLDYWQLSGLGDLNQHTFTFGAGDSEITAVWKTKNYSITYFLNDGTWADQFTPITSYTIETPSFDLPTQDNLYKEHYTFVGWYNNHEFTEPNQTIITLGSTGNISLYAKWKYANYDITFFYPYGEEIVVTKPYTHLYTGTNEYEIGKEYTFNDVPYTLIGYTQDPESYEAEWTSGTKTVLGISSWYSVWTNNLGIRIDQITFTHNFNLSSQTLQKETVSDQTYTSIKQDFNYNLLNVFTYDEPGILNDTSFENLNLPADYIVGQNYKIGSIDYTFYGWNSSPQTINNKTWNEGAKLVNTDSNWYAIWLLSKDIPESKTTQHYFYLDEDTVLDSKTLTHTRTIQNYQELYTYNLQSKIELSKGTPTDWSLKELTLPNTRPTKTYYNFIGWSKNISDNNVWYEGTKSLNENSKWYATYSPIQYTITIDDEVYMIYTIESKILLPEKPKQNNIFKGYKVISTSENSSWTEKQYSEKELSFNSPMHGDVKLETIYVETSNNILIILLCIGGAVILLAIILFIRRKRNYD